MIRIFNLRMVFFVACLSLLMIFVVLESCGVDVGLFIKIYLVIGLDVAF